MSIDWFCIPFDITCKECMSAIPKNVMVDAKKKQVGTRHAKKKCSFSFKCYCCGSTIVVMETSRYKAWKGAIRKLATTSTSPRKSLGYVGVANKRSRRSFGEARRAESPAHLGVAEARTRRASHKSHRRMDISRRAADHEPRGWDDCDIYYPDGKVCQPVSEDIRDCQALRKLSPITYQPVSEDIRDCQAWRKFFGRDGSEDISERPAACGREGYVGVAERRNGMPFSESD